MGLFSKKESSSQSRDIMNTNQQKNSLGIPEGRPEEKRKSSFTRFVHNMLDDNIDRGKGASDADIKKQTGMTREEMNAWAAERMAKMNKHDADAFGNTSTQAKTYGHIAGGGIGTGFNSGAIGGAF